jgi:hypothetical protein
MLRTRPKSTWRRATRNTLVADDMREIMAGREAEGERLSTIRTSVSYRGRWLPERDIEPRLSAPDSCTIRGVGRLLAVLAVVVLVMPACSEVGEQVDQATNDTVARALSANVRDRLAEEGIELEGDPECTTDMNLDGVDLTGTAECTGTTTDGRSAKANFDGTLSPGSCEGSFVIEVDGEQVVDLTEIPGCSIEF